MVQIVRPGITQIEANPSVQAGTLYTDPASQNTYIYVQASAALTVGQVCIPVTNGLLINDAETTAGAVDGTTITATGIFTAAALAGSTAVGVQNGHILRFLYDANATGYGQGGVVLNRVSDNVVDIYVEAGSANSVSPDGRLDAATAGTNGIVIITLTRVAASGAATDHAICVAQGAVTDEYWFWGLYKGGGYVMLDASGNAIDATNRFLIPAGSGLATGSSGTTGEDERECAFARAFIDMAGTNDRLVYCQVDCETQWTMGVPPAPRNARIPYPSWFGARYST